VCAIVLAAQCTARHDSARVCSLSTHLLHVRSCMHFGAPFRPRARAQTTKHVSPRTGLRLSSYFLLRELEPFNPQKLPAFALQSCAAHSKLCACCTWWRARMCHPRELRGPRAQSINKSRNAHRSDRRAQLYYHGRMGIRTPDPPQVRLQRAKRVRYHCAIRPEIIERLPLEVVLYSTSRQRCL
jgi:hypothetical protein